MWGSETVAATLRDLHDAGYGLETRRAIPSGCRVAIRGEVADGASVRTIETEGVVRWCVGGPNGTFLCGVVVSPEPPAAFGSAEPDYYEILQLSPNADPDTVHRMFRVLAQRFHPDNAQTGDAAAFKTLARAYEVLGDPPRRAAYDAQRPEQQARRWRIFDSAESAQGMEAEKRKRHGILSLLYLRRSIEPRDPNMAPAEFEQLLGCPREHLEFAFWVLKEDGWIARSDNGRVSITARGVHEAEAIGEFSPSKKRLIEAPG